MRRRLFYLSVACYVALLSHQPIVSAGSAISVPPEARDTAAAAIAAAQDILDKEQEMLYRNEAEVQAEKAKAEATAAEQQVDETKKTASQYVIKAEEAAVKAQAAAEQAKEAASHSAALGEEARQAIAAAEAAYQDADTIEASLQAEEAALLQRQRTRTENAVTVVQKAQPATLEDTDELLKMEKEIRLMEKMLKDAELARQRNTPMIEAPVGSSAVDWSKAEAAHARADKLNRIATAADKRAEQAERMADEKNASAEASAALAAEAKQELLDAQVVVNEAEEYALQSKKYAAQTKAELEQLVYTQEHPKGLHLFAWSINYYRAQDGFGNSGYQFTEPLYFGYWQKDFSYGLSTKNIISQVSINGASSRVNTLSDTTISFTKRNEKTKFIVDYGMNVNIPTGKSALSWSERYAMMNEDVVEVSQFGKGWQLTPGIDVSWKNGKEDIWTIGTSYAFSGSYDPTSDIPDDDVSPGGEWRKLLRWQHIGQKWQFVGELINTSTGLSKIANGNSYATGDQWEYRLTYNRILPHNQNIMFYYWREDQNMNDIVPANTTNAIVHYFGTMWSKKLDDKHVLRVTFDVMETNGSRFASVNNYYDADGKPQYTAINVDGRTKYTFGLGYDIKFNAKSNLSIDLQKFTMKDGESTLGTPPRTYNGFNILTRYNRSI